MNRAIFLDRDGTINNYVPDLKHESQFELKKSVPEAIKAINDAGYLAIVATNQPDIAKGYFTFAELERVHEKMQALLLPAKIDAIYVCPHHPEKGFLGEVPELKIVCECRKPKPGLLLRAAKEHNIDLTRSWMIGDSLTDVVTGKSAGARSILVAGAGSTSRDEQQLKKAGIIPEYTANSLLEAVKYALRNGDDL
jgi:D-glycero-D-manno-heptose 1,7-bisphosphate phosphatase